MALLGQSIRHRAAIETRVAEASPRRSLNKRTEDVKRRADEVASVASPRRGVSVKDSKTIVFAEDAPWRRYGNGHRGISLLFSGVAPEVIEFNYPLKTFPRKENARQDKRQTCRHNDMHNTNTVEKWWSCRGTAPRVQDAYPARSTGLASALSCSTGRPEARLTGRCRFFISTARRITRADQPEFMTGRQSGSGRLSASGD